MSRPSSAPKVPATELSQSMSGRISESATNTTALPSLMPSTVFNVSKPGSFRHQSATYAPPMGALTTTYSAASTKTFLPVIPAPSDIQQNRAKSTSSPIAIGGSSRERKSKPHVAFACINCKRSHLSCDANRPCTRCVVSGRQDTCVDVQHKKRGRPRLREEDDLKPEQAIAEDGLSSPGIMIDKIPTRHIASTRLIKREPFHLQNSQGSDSTFNSGLTRSYPPPAVTYVAFAHDHQAPPPRIPAPVVPTAYLDMDLFFIKANLSWRHIMLEGQDIEGLQLSDIVTPSDGHSFQDIRNRLLSERETCEPSYMAPINQPGRDHLHGVSEVDVESVTFGFDDNTFLWTQIRFDPIRTFSARVRLAKASIYFVAITLPGFKSAVPISLPNLQPHLISTPRISPPQRLRIQTLESCGACVRPQTVPSVPQSSFIPFLGIQRSCPSSLQIDDRQSPPRTYSLIQQRAQVSHQAPPLRIASLVVTEPSIQGTPVSLPRISTREVFHTHPALTRSHLSQVADSRAAPSELNSANPSVDQETPILPQSQVNNTDDDGTWKKRRRQIGLAEVLH